jgi:hypothetical protein
VEERNARHAHELAVHEANVREQRFVLLRAERREVYRQCLATVMEYMQAIRELRDAGLPPLPDASVADSAAAHPPLARVLAATSEMTRIQTEVALVAGREVREEVDELALALLQSVRAAVARREDTTGVAGRAGRLSAVMHRELAGTLPQA